MTNRVRGIMRSFVGATGAAICVTATSGTALADDPCGHTWHLLAGGSPSSTVEAATIYNGDLVIGGWFTSVNNQTVNYIARWNSEEGWQPFVDNGHVGLNGFVWALTVYQGDLIAGGNFTTAGGETVNRIVRWDGEQWHPFVHEGQIGFPGGFAEVRALTVRDDELIVGGLLGLPDAGPEAWHVVRWDGSEFSGTAPLDGAVHGWDVPFSLAVYDGELIVAGDFTTDGQGGELNHIARFDENAQQWKPLAGSQGIGLNNGMFTKMVPHGDDLIVGGWFTQAGGKSVARIARWDGEDWYPLEGGGVNDNIYSLEAYEGGIVAGGVFTSAGGQTANSIAFWDGSEWHPLIGQDGVNGLPEGNPNSTVFAMAADGEDLFVGGSFKALDGLAENVVRWAPPDPPFMAEIGEVQTYDGFGHIHLSIQKDPFDVNNCIGHCGLNWTPANCSCSHLCDGPEPPCCGTCTHQWYHNGVPIFDNDDYVGTNHSTLTIFNIRPELAGEYTVVVETPCETFSQTGHLVVNEPLAIDVPGDYATIQQAVDSVPANATAVITLAPGTYNEAPDLSGKAIHLRSAEGPEVTTIELGGGTIRIEGEPLPPPWLPPAKQIPVTIEGLTITEGGGTWGAFEVRYSSPTFINCILQENSGGLGAMSFVASESSPIIEDCHFKDNTGNNAGAISFENTAGEAVIRNSTFTNNTALALGGVGGVLVMNTGTVSIENSHFEGNIGQMTAGAVVINVGEVDIMDSTFCDNSPTHVYGPFNDLGGNKFVDGPCVIHVPGDYPSIMAAINAAADGAEIIVAPGTYVEQVDFMGKPIHVRSAEGPETTILDGVGSFTPVLAVNFEGPQTILEGFTIVNGLGGGIGGGGGMSITHSSPTIINCIFENNLAPDGGGMGILDGSPAIIGSIFRNNTAGFGDGGAILSSHESLPDIENTLFCENSPTHIVGPWNDLGGNEFHDECPEECEPADLNCDGVVDGADLGILLANWGDCDECDDCIGDINGDCVVDGADLGILLANWG